jgi:pimeloyl-ACP methyl ester carboxylesterase
MSDAWNDGVRIHYEVEGSGPPLVLQHGITQSVDAWRRGKYVDELKSHYRLILVDARGHGASDKPHDAAAYASARRAGDVVAVLDSLGIERAHYWGYSMGGLIGFGMAAHAPQRLRSLVIGGQHPYEFKAPEGLPNGADARAFLVAYTRNLGVDFDALPEADRQRALANDTRAIAAAVHDRPSLEPVLSSIGVPCLLYAGEADRVFARVRRAAEAIPGCAFVTLPGFNHHRAFHGGAAIILPKVLEFLRRVEERTT